LNRRKIMTAKAVTKRVTETVSASVNGPKPLAAQPDYKLIPWKDLQTSPTNPRRRINEQTIESLAASIRIQGVLEPLIVRQVDKKYEIVCGERRYLASQIAGLTELPCLVRDLSDEQVLDIQIHENLHREDIHPMDEAYGYQFLKEKLGCDVKELSLRVGKSEGYVLNRLKLNLLIKEAQKDIDDGYLPLVYALEIAKYAPSIQKLIYGEVYRKEGRYVKDDYVVVPNKEQVVPFKSIIEWINSNVHRLLSKAPFDSKATNLHPDGLACIKCPERTGAVVSLFEPNQIGKKDSCLNPACYQRKLHNHVEVRRTEIAKKAGIDVSEVPIVRSWCYADGEGYFGTESCTVIGAIRGGSGKNCKHAVSSIDIEPDNYGQIFQVCLKTTKCKVHWPEAKGSTHAGSTNKSDEEIAAAKLEAHRSRREEIWNAKVAEAVRVRIFKQAAERFEQQFKITDVGIDFLPQLIARLWRMTSSGDSNNLNGVVKYLVAEWGGESKKGEGIYIHDMRTAIEEVKKLQRGLQYRILFLLIHGHKGTIGYGNNYSSQKEVRSLAAEFAVDYMLIDAEVRLEFCSKKHKEIHQTYLEGLKGKTKDTKIPHLFSEKWKPKD
jgi:ParB family transcriptional regulator, chromosome partitioning protein